jgi:hypothetical protein
MTAHTLTVRGAPPGAKVSVTLELTPLIVWSSSPDDVIAVTGLDRRDFREALKAMDDDPVHKRHVINLNRKKRGAEIEHFLAFVRSRTAAGEKGAAK